MTGTRSPVAQPYWHAVRSPRYSLSFAFALLLIYEALACLLSGSDLAGVRNGADVLLKNLFAGLGGRYGLAGFGLLLLGGGAALVWQDRRTGGGIRLRYFGMMAGESIGYALVFGLVAATLTSWLLPGLASIAPGLAAGSGLPLSLPAQLMVSLGAGIYEELLFRVLLVSGLALIGKRILGWRAGRANLGGVVVGAFLFAGFHYLGPYGDRLALDSFTFRTIAGLLFSALYVLRHHRMDACAA